MANPAHKIAGPMLRTRDPVTGKPRAPATVEQVTDAFVIPGFGLRAPRVVVDEWINEAKRRNGMPGDQELIGKKFRAEQELRRRPKVKAKPTRKRLSMLQRVARRITRLFRKH